MNKKISVFFIVASITFASLFSMSNEEITYFNARTQSVETAYKKIGFSRFPKIGFCFSGGGIRALISSLGFMLGAQEINLGNQVSLMDLCHCISALSGSTWMLGNHYARRNLPIQETRNFLRINLQHKFFDKFFPTINAIAQNLEIQFRDLHEIQMVDLWGGMIAARTLADIGATAHTIHFADLIPAINTSEYSDFVQRYPYPIFNAVHPIANCMCSCCWTPFRSTNYEWFEITPYHMKKSFDTTVIATRGSEALSNCPMTLGYLMGICGSAYSVNIHDIAAFFKESIKDFFAENLRSYFTEEAKRVIPSRDRGILLQELLASIRLGRFAPARITFNDEELTLVDAGICFNLPTPPLLERNMDIIFICDASSNAYSREFPELKKAARFAAANGLPFPNLNNITFATPELQVFQDSDANTPIIIYFHNPIEFDTTKMSYTSDEFNQLCGYMEAAVIRNVATIQDIIRAKATQLANQSA